MNNDIIYFKYTLPGRGIVKMFPIGSRSQMEQVAKDMEEFNNLLVDKTVDSVLKAYQDTIDLTYLGKAQPFIPPELDIEID